MAFCEECGAPLVEGARFCERCGAPVAGAAPDETEAVRDARTNATVEMPRPDAAVGSRPGERGNERRPEPERQPQRKSRLPLIIGIVVAVVAIAVAALYVVPLFIPHPYDPNTHTANLPPEEKAKKDSADPDARKIERWILDEDTKEKDEKPTDSTSSSKETTDGSKETTEGTKETGQTSSQTTQPSETDTQKTDQNTQKPTQTTEEAKSYDTTEKPELKEFTSWFSNDLMNGNAPADITRITDLGTVSGGWKAFIYNYAVAGNEHSKSSEELLNVRIDGTEDDTNVIFDWYYARTDGKTYENKQPDSAYVGTWAHGRIEALGAGSVRLTDFWEQDGHQYAIGRITWPDAVDGTIALVRP